MGSIPTFSAETESRNGIARVALRGELDVASAHVLNDRLAPLEFDGVAAIVLDLRDVSFIDSSGLHALLNAWRRVNSNGSRLLLMGIGPTARRLLAITGTEFLLDDDAAAAVLAQFTGGNGSRDGVEAVADGVRDA